tara:strand:+ start:156 stop:368 length:213 start_codon:yes stop_codon:yes gene_type:complete
LCYFLPGERRGGRENNVPGFSRRRRPRPYSELTPPVNPWWSKLLGYGVTLLIAAVLVAFLVFGGWVTWHS